MLVTVLALEYVKVWALDLAGGLLLGALVFGVLEVLARRAGGTDLLASVSAIALRFGGILISFICSLENGNKDVRTKRGEKYMFDIVILRMTFVYRRHRRVIYIETRSHMLV
jgi:hypothetical protein